MHGFVHVSRGFFSGQAPYTQRRLSYETFLYIRRCRSAGARHGSDELVAERRRRWIRGGRGEGKGGGPGGEFVWNVGNIWGVGHVRHRRGRSNGNEQHVGGNRHSGDFRDGN